MSEEINSLENDTAKIEVSPEIHNMTRKEALNYMGVPENSTLYVIDDKFWQLSKRYRSENTKEAEAKLEELSVVYDIATGARDKRLKEQEAYAKEKKIFGKTNAEWKNYFHYTWYKYLIGIALVAVLCNLLYVMVLKPRNDVSVIALGHFAYEDDVLEDILINECGYKNPYINAVDVVPENEEGQTDNGYGDQTASTVLMTQPEVIICDTECVYYYFSQFADCREVYEELRELLPSDVFSKLTPVYYSEREYQELAYEYEMSMDMYENDVDESVFDEYSDEPVMIGIRVDDEEFMTTLGFTNNWHFVPGRLVFSVGANSDDRVGAQNILIQILSRVK